MTDRTNDHTNINIDHLRCAAISGLVLLLVFCMLFLFDTEPAYAAPEGSLSEAAAAETGVQGGAVEVTDYVMDAAVRKDHSYEVTETISVNIPDQLQKIEFAIPSGKFRMSGLEVDGVEYGAEYASQTGVVTINDPDKLTAGLHEYTINYTISEYKDLDDAKDMFWFNVMLPEWRQPVGKVLINVTFPEDFPWDDMQCYAGQFGVQDVNNKIDFDADESTHTVTVKGDHIPENFGITLKAQLPDGYWEDTLDGSWSIAAITLIMAGVSLILFIMWLIGGRDPKVKREKVTKPIEGLSPVEMGYVFNSEVRTRDVLHMIIQFAQKGYLRISEYEPKKYRLYKGNMPSGEERMYRNAYRILFEDVYKGRALEMDRIAQRVERIRAAIEDDVAAGFNTSEGSAFTPLSRALRYAGAAVLGVGVALSNAISYYYNYSSPNITESLLTGVLTALAALLLCRVIDRRDSSSVSSGRFIEGAAAFIFILPVAYVSYRISINTGKPYLPVPMIVASALAAFFIVIMRARGKENAVLVNRIRRLRNFIYHPTPKELLENHLADSNYYYDMMLYALAFGAEESWAISFLTLEVPGHEWYSDDIEGHAFSNLKDTSDTINYARDLRSFIRTFESRQK